MRSRQILLTVLALFCFAKQGVTTKCRKCSGDIDTCNNQTAVEQTCVDGQDKCSSMIITKDGEKNVILGCASQDDCDAGVKSCAETEKQVRTTCVSTCCSGDRCNTPPPKETNLKCFECQSALSMDHCVQNSKAVTCSDYEDSCAKFTAELVMGDKKLMVYRKGCRAKDACEKKANDLFLQACESDDTCENLCCTSDLCNAGSFSAVSVTLMFVGAFMAVVSM